MGGEEGELMSTKSSISYLGHDSDHSHTLCAHIYNEMHQPKGTVVVEFWCSTCYCHYEFLMNEHLGKQLAKLIGDNTGKENV